MEADLLSVYFEELSAFRGEQHAEMVRKQGQSGGDPSWHTDMVLEDEDDE
jgi:hypothetical protein